MEHIKSILEFKNYVVNEVIYKRNNNFNDKDESISISLNIEPNIEINENSMIINLIAYIFEGAEENNYPFEMTVNITGHFEVQGESPRAYQANAIAILYPYIRAIVSTYTSAANIQPLILPAINVNAMLENQNKKD